MRLIFRQELILEVKDFKMKRYLLCALLVIIFPVVVSSQDISERQEVAVFSLSYSDWSIPSGALGMVDQQIVEVITNLGRFNVKGLDLRLGASDVSEFTGMIKRLNESNLVIDEKYRLGEETFTEADFKRLTESFIIVVPSLTYYDSVVSDSGNGAVWEVELQTAFSFIKVADSRTIAQFSIDTYGTGETQQEATHDAAGAVSTQLDYELRSIEEFRLKSGILEVMAGNNVIIELGSNLGLARGDEFNIVNTRMLPSGHTVQDKTGLVIVTEVKQEISYAKVLYSGGGAVPGDQLAEIPRMGTDMSVYARAFIGEGSLNGGTAGIKTVAARGFYGFRPYAGLELPFVSGALYGLGYGFPVTLFGGGELMWYLGRLQVEPSLHGGITGLVPVEDEQAFMITHAGFDIALNLNWMFTDGFRFFINGGYGYWHALDGSSAAILSYGGIFAGLGVTLKL